MWFSTRIEKADVHGRSVSSLSAEPVRMPEQMHLSGVYKLPDPNPVLTHWQRLPLVQAAWELGRHPEVVAVGGIS